jgi:ADP-dependent NAD(P)H-hydrate dehydratase / NAD(P)H-hydrate epimerase
VLPILTPAEMAEVDAAAPEPLEVLVGRAGWAVAQRARAILGGTYGRRVSVIAGKGNNGADGRVAAELLSRQGVRCEVVEPGGALSGNADLVIDAAYGTGLRAAWDEPVQPVVPVLAVDIPSGVDGLTGADLGSLRADWTITFAALKPGLLLQPGAQRTGRCEIADIGLDVGNARAHLVEDDDLRRVDPVRAPDTHKWHQAVRVIAGSPGMGGAAALAASAAQRGGAGMVVVSSPGVAPSAVQAPVETVVRATSADDWPSQVLDDIDRFGSLAVGPGLGVDSAALRSAATLIASCPVPMVVDADAITAVAAHPECVRAAAGPVVLTPHDGEFARLGGVSTGDRIADVRAVAADLGCIVLLKGPTTIVADPEGDVRVVTSGTPALATAGSGDVLTGVVAALLARGSAPALDATAAAAHWHGLAARLANRGAIASDLPPLLPAARRGVT